MKKVLVLIIQLLISNIALFSQKYDPVTVRAGMRVVDCFSFDERYRYPEFVTGRIQVQSGVYAEAKLNYNFLSGEMEYKKQGYTCNCQQKGYRIYCCRKGYLLL